MLDSYDGWKVYKRGEYLLIRVDRLHMYPLHRYIWQKANGIIPPRMVIHHIDGDTMNNDLENLMCVSTKDHTRIHGGWVKDGSEWVAKPCGACGEVKPLKAFYKKRAGYSTHCKICHRANVAKYVAENPEKHKKAMKKSYLSRKAKK